LPIQAQNLTGRITQDLGVAIVTGQYSSANPFPTEAALCHQYGASRTVLREAVKMLTAKGLLSARAHYGTRVEPEEHWNLLDPDVLRWLLERRFSNDLLVEFTEIRLSIEPGAAALAAHAAQTSGLAAIQAALERMNAAERGHDDPLESDIAFHVAILEASGNRFYLQLRELIETALRFSIRITNRNKGVRLANVADHKKISDAILAGHPDAAADAMRTLISEVLDLIKGGARPNVARTRGATLAGRPQRN
jgi:DNA-binding FadR family transcriptional regulator